MKKNYRVAIRVTRELYDRLQRLAMQNRSDSISQEARILLEKALGIKRKSTMPTTTNVA